MGTEEKRKKDRIDSLNLLEVSVDENKIVVNQGMGRTLNVSASGILLETHFPIDLKNAVSLTIAVENELIQINGKAVHFRAGDTGTYETGVQFTDTDESTIQAIKKLVTAFQKH